MNSIKSTEYIEDLQYKGLFIILDKSLPSFTTDAVLLADFARVKRTDFVADFGTGTGILPLLMHGRYGMRAIGFELQSELCNMAQHSFELNGLSDFLSAENADYTSAYKKYNGAFSAVVCNPPYFDEKSGFSAPDNARALSRTQLSCSLDDTLCAANKVLKSGGDIFICYPAVRLPEILSSMCMNKLEPKVLRFVRTQKEKSPYLVLVKGRKDAGKSLSYEPDLVLMNPDGSESDELRRIYHRD